MARFRLEFDCDSGAFGESREERSAEVVRILLAHAAKIEGMTQGYPFGPVRDVNGNTIGDWVLAE